MMRADRHPCRTAVPLLGALWHRAGRRAPNLREAITLLTAVLLFVRRATAARCWRAQRPELQLFELLPGLQIAFRVEPLGMLFALIASGLWIVNSLYSIGYMRGNQERNQTRFYVCFALALGSAMGIAFAGNLLTLFLFYEVLTLITYPLVTHPAPTRRAPAGAYLPGLLMGTSVVFLLPAL
jgi:multicomponent Na+:H+ antiporter subunit D